jgi:CubicO group peptidase (beta-lactamase class C family)
MDDRFTRQEGVQYWWCTRAGETSIVCEGLAHHTPPARVTPRTTFHCFSTTKPVTALVVLQLVAQDLVDLDAPMTAYLPDIPYRNDATVRQVLSHQAGLPNPLPLSWVHADHEHARFDAAAFLERVLHTHRTCAAPGRRARYSNIGYLLLGRLIEVVTGRAFTDVVRERILDVVSCNDPVTGAYLGFEIPVTGHATGYTRRWSGLGLLLSVFPDPAHLRSAEGAWIRYRPFHLNGAAYGGLKGNVLGWAPLLHALATRDPRLLPSDVYDTYFAPQTLTSGAPSGHAVSWFTGRVAGHEYLCHAGGGPGYGAEIRIYPASGAASALLVNTTIVSDARLLDRLDARWLPAP